MSLPVCPLSRAGSDHQENQTHVPLSPALEVWAWQEATVGPSISLDSEDSPQSCLPCPEIEVKGVSRLGDRPPGAQQGRAMSRPPSR